MYTRVLLLLGDRIADDGDVVARFQGQFRRGRVVPKRNRRPGPNQKNSRAGSWTFLEHGVDPGE